MASIAMIAEWLRRLIRRLLGRKDLEEPSYKDIVDVHEKVSEDVGQVLRRQYQKAREARPRTTIRPSDGGFRKLRRHRSGRQYEKRSGIDHNKRMVDIKDTDTRPPRRKKGGWAEDRHAD